MTHLSPTDESIADKLAVRFSDWTILVLNVNEDSPVLSRFCDEMRKDILDELRNAHAATLDKLRAVEARLAEAEGLLNEYWLGGLTRAKREKLDAITVAFLAQKDADHG